MLPLGEISLHRLYILTVRLRRGRRTIERLRPQQTYWVPAWTRSITKPWIRLAACSLLVAVFVFVSSTAVLAGRISSILESPPPPRAEIVEMIADVEGVSPADINVYVIDTSHELPYVPYSVAGALSWRRLIACRSYIACSSTPGGSHGVGSLGEEAGVSAVILASRPASASHPPEGIQVRRSTPSYLVKLQRMLPNSRLQSTASHISGTCEQPMTVSSFYQTKGSAPLPSQISV